MTHWFGSYWPLWGHDRLKMAVYAVKSSPSTFAELEHLLKFKGSKNSFRTGGHGKGLIVIDAVLQIHLDQHFLEEPSMTFNLTILPVSFRALSFRAYGGGSYGHGLHVLS